MNSKLVGIQSKSVRLAVIVGAALVTSSVLAAPIIASGSVNIFRTITGVNNVGVAAGDRLQFGADIVGGSSGTTLVATYPGTSFSDTTTCSPLSTSANFCAGTATYSTARLGPYTLTFTKAGMSTQLTTPNLAGSQSAVPFAGGFNISNQTTTPTLSWVIPPSVFVDGLRINIFDEDVVRPGTTAADVIHSVALSELATSYLVPRVLSSGQVLNVGGHYTFALQIIETRTRAAFTGNNSEILARTQTFYDFDPTSLAVDPPPVGTVPAPGTFALALFGLLGSGVLRRRK